MCNTPSSYIVVYKTIFLANRAGRIYWSGVFDPEDRMDIGSVAQLIDGPTPQALGWNRGNMMRDHGGV